MTLNKKAAESQAQQQVIVSLVPKNWIPFNTFELAIRCGEVPVLTDYGYARLEISRLQIDFGSTTYGRSGSIERFLAKKVGETVEKFLKSSRFLLVVLDKNEHSVRFKLESVGLPVKGLEFSSHFETSQLTFEHVLQASVQKVVGSQGEDEALVA